MKKYELIKESKTTFMGRDIYRIRALKDFGDVIAGDIGGWVCSENNLSQEGDCWIYDEAKCLDNAKIFANAIMLNNSIMYDEARMFDNSKMFDDAEMYDNSIMRDNSIMYNNSTMCDNSIMCDNSTMYNNSIMRGNSIMRDNSELEDCILYGKVCTKFKKIFQYQCKKRLLTAILTEQNEILYSIGCQIGITKEKFIDRIYNDCKIKGKGLEEYPYRQEYLDIIDIVENYLRKFI